MRKRTKIMIIDDSYANRILFRAVLEELDIEVTEVHSANKALSILNKVKPDIILLDMCMPMMSGIEFLQNLKELKKVIPVIVVSVLDDQSQIKEAFFYGASDYLIKPIESDELVKCISRFTECEVII